MPKSLLLLAIGLFFGTGLGFVLAASSGAKLAGHDHSAHGLPHDSQAAFLGLRDADMGRSGEAGAHLHHRLLDVSGDGRVPGLTLSLHPDGERSWNLRIGARDFHFSPTAVNEPHVAGQGHAHIYVNGKKYARAYGEWVHLANLPQGEIEVRVTLNANDHRQMADGTVPIEATLRIPPS